MNSLCVDPTQTHPLCATDLGLLRYFWQAQHMLYRYEYSWQFTIQYIRNSPHIYYDNENIFSFGVDHIDPTVVTCIGPIGPNVHLKVRDFARCLISQQRYQSLNVRYLDRTEFEHFINVGFKARNPKFPQVVINVDHLLSLEGGRWSKIRLRLNRFRGSYNFECITLDKDNFSLGIRACQEWQNSYLARFADLMQRPPIINNFEWLLENIGRTPLSAKQFGFVVMVSDNPSALCFSAPVSDVCVGLYINISDTSIAGLAEYIIYEMARRVSEDGYKYLNLGHSDIASTHQFKLKFNPVHLFDSFSVYYNI